MNDDAPPLRPASQEEIERSLSFALRYDGCRRIRHADDAMARITAERLVRHLQDSGTMLMKRSDDAAPSTSGHTHPASGECSDTFGRRRMSQSARLILRADSDDGLKRPSSSDH